MTVSHLPFDATFRKTLRDLVLWRRDVRRFRTDPVPEAGARRGTVSGTFFHAICTGRP